MDERGLFWPDVLSAIDTARDVQGGGTDRWDRPKWIVTGPATDGRLLAVLCVLDVDEAGNVVVLLTLYHVE